MKDFGTCFLDYGAVFNPSITNVGPIATPEAIHLGKSYEVFVGPLARRVRIVKNTSGGTLTACQTLKYSTTASRFGLDVTVTTDANDPCAGVVEDGYKGGVPNGYWFRMVEKGKHQLILQTTTGSDTTLVNGDVLVCSDDNGMVHKQTVDAAGVKAAMGRTLIATTSGVENGLKFNAEVNVAFQGL